MAGQFGRRFRAPCGGFWMHFFEWRRYLKSTPVTGCQKAAVRSAVRTGRMTFCHFVFLSAIIEIRNRQKTDTTAMFA